ncbi:MAG: zinc-ribbon domain-containing protein [Prevotella sp.]|nr:zinc-ribbon domain-containing protein [Prevotella sp.]
MFCRFCGKELPNDSLFCPNCGKKLVETTQENIDLVKCNNSRCSQLINEVQQQKEELIPNYSQRQTSLIENTIQKRVVEVCDTNNEKQIDEEKEGDSNVGVEEVPNDEDEVYIDDSSDAEDDIETLPLFRRFIGSIIDKIFILILFFVGMNFIDSYMDIDQTVTCFVWFNLFYYMLSELTGASLGKKILGGLAIDMRNFRRGILSKIHFVIVLFRGLIGGGLIYFFIQLIHVEIGLSYFKVAFYFFLCMDVPVFFTKRSLLDLLTDTIYVKEETR